jgi:hypothetical protein
MLMFSEDEAMFVIEMCWWASYPADYTQQQEIHLSLHVPAAGRTRRG